MDVGMHVSAHVIIYFGDQEKPKAIDIFNGWFSKHPALIWPAHTGN